jgi:hypothetical protein
MAWNPGRFNFFSPDRPGPSLLHTAAATSLTSFTNVSGQPKSRKRERDYFLAFGSMSRRSSIFGRFFGVFSRVEAPDFSQG